MTAQYQKQKSFLQTSSQRSENHQTTKKSWCTLQHPCACCSKASSWCFSRLRIAAGCICLSQHRTVAAHVWNEAMKIHSTCNCFSTYTCFRNFHSGPGLGQSCKFSCGHNLFVSQEHFFWYSFVQKEASCIFGALMLLMQIKEKSGGATGLFTSTLLIQANPSM